jgi:hypothetical protein
MSSKNTPHIVGLIGAPRFATSTVIFGWAHTAEIKIPQMDTHNTTLGLICLSCIRSCVSALRSPVRAKASAAPWDHHIVDQLCLTTRKDRLTPSQPQPLWIARPLSSAGQALGPDHGPNLAEHQCWHASKRFIGLSSFKPLGSRSCSIGQDILWLSCDTARMSVPRAGGSRSETSPSQLVSVFLTNRNVMEKLPKIFANWRNRNANLSCFTALYYG